MLAPLLFDAATGPSGGGLLLGLVVLPFVGGAAGATVLLAGGPDWQRGQLGFGFGAIPAAALVFFTLISLQGGGRPDYAWIATGCGIGFGLFGTIGGGFINARLSIAGGLCFGGAGAAFGGVMAAGLLAGGVAKALALLPLAVGGALFGAAKNVLQPD